MSPGLDGVRRAAREGKGRETGTVHPLAPPSEHRTAPRGRLRRASPGVDGAAWQEYETGLEDGLIDLHSRVHRGTGLPKVFFHLFSKKMDDSTDLQVATL
jgi:hypothetical protein